MLIIRVTMCQFADTTLHMAWNSSATKAWLSQTRKRRYQRMSRSRRPREYTTHILREVTVWSAMIRRYSPPSLQAERPRGRKRKRQSKPLRHRATVGAAWWCKKQRKHRQRETRETCLTTWNMSEGCANGTDHGIVDRDWLCCITDGQI